MVWMSGISCSDKLVHPDQTNERDARREMCFFHAMIYEGTERFVQFENQMKRVTTSIIALQLWHLAGRFTFACE